MNQDSNGFPVSTLRHRCEYKGQHGTDNCDDTIVASFRIVN